MSSAHARLRLRVVLTPLIVETTVATRPGMRVRLDFGMDQG